VGESKQRFLKKARKNFCSFQVVAGFKNVVLKEQKFFASLFYKKATFPCVLHAV